jgi:uncharacterized protein (UPF0548 family)
VLFVRRPARETLDRILRRSREADVTYAEVGYTRVEDWPPGYRHDVDEARLGHGRETFESTVAALRGWQAHLGAGLELFPAGAAVAEGDTVLLLTRAAGLWNVAPSRIVYVAEEPDSFRYGYGTLPGHPERGEASFAVHRNEQDEMIFRVASFSRPVDPLARLAKPLARRIQRRIALRYLTALRSAAAP